MAKKSEINKKGRLAKSTLSVVLAASMVLTSSSFVWAAPVEDIAVVEESETAVEAVEAPVEEAVGTRVDDVVDTSIEENVKAVATTVTATVVAGQNLTYNGKEIRPTLEVKATSTEYGDDQTVDPTEYEVTYSKNIDAGQADFTVSFPAGSKYYGTDAKTGNFTIAPMTLTDANTKVNYKPHSGFVYNGAEQSPEVASVVVTTNDGKITLDSSDYELKANAGTSDLKSAGVDKKVGVSVINENYEAGALLGVTSYNIDQSPFNKNTVTIESNPVAYTGNPVAADVIVKNNAGDVLESSVDYEIAYYDAEGNTASGPQTDMGTYKIQVKSVTPATDKNYVAGGVVDSTYTITKGTLALAAEKAVLAGTSKDPKTNEYCMTYNGSEQSVTGVTISGLTINKDFKVDLTAAKGTDVGSFDVTIQGINDYAGQKVIIPVVIRPMPILAADIEATHAAGKFVYSAILGKTQNGAEADNAILTLTRYVDGTAAKDVVLKEGTDYTYTTDKSKGTVVITGMGNYTTVDPNNAKVTSAVKNYTKSDKIRLEGSNITGNVSGTYAYTGEKITPPAANITVMDNGIKLVKDTDYTISYGDADNNKNAGEGTVIITGIGKYDGTKTLTFEITGIAVDSKFKIAEIEDISYTTAATPGAGKVVPTIVYIASGAIAPTGAYDISKIKYFRNGKEISADTDFVKVGTIDIEVPGKGEYVGTLKASYKIVGDDIAKAAKVDAIKDQTYTGKAVEPVVTVTNNTTNKLLVKDTDYAVTYDNNVESGTAYATITGIGNYSGRVVIPFNIIGQMEQEIVVLPAQERDLQKRTLKSKATVVKYTTAPKTEVTYTSSNPEVVTVDEKTGAIEYKAVGTAKITIKAAESEIYKAAEKELTVKILPTTPANVKVTSTAKKKIAVKASEVQEAAKYQIKIWKTGKKAVFVNVDNKGDLSKVYTTKSAGKFNVQVRAYKTIDNVHHFSTWSAVKTVTVK